MGNNNSNIILIMLDGEHPYTDNHIHISGEQHPLSIAQQVHGIIEKWFESSSNEFNVVVLTTYSSFALKKFIRYMSQDMDGGHDPELYSEALNSVYQWSNVEGKYIPITEAHDIQWLGCFRDISRLYEDGKLNK